VLTILPYEILDPSPGDDLIAAGHCHKGTASAGNSDEPLSLDASILPVPRGLHDFFCAIGGSSGSATASAAFVGTGARRRAC
jgi:hypothetical protein